MAFNPFHTFRKHQKKFMALLTVMCMIIFVFQFGRGDAFDRVLGVFRFWGSKGEPVTKLYGDTVTDYDLDRVRRKRKLAQQFVGNFMLGYQAEAVSKFVETKPGSDTKGLLSPAIEKIAQNLVFAYRILIQFRQQMPLDTLPQDLETIRNELAAGVGKDPQRLSAIQSVAAMAATYMSMRVHPPTSHEPLYTFGGDTSNRDLLDFQIWKRQADKLGITLTDADVGREVNRMFGGSVAFEDGVPFERAVVVQQFVSSGDRDRRATQGPTADELLEALRNEFRVQFAKEALLGHGSGWRYWFNRTQPTRVSPAASTPYEFLDYYRDQRTTLRVGVLDLPTANFVPQVKGEPSEQVLRNSYEQWKDREPKPDDPTPGFKEPRRIRVAYMRVDPESAFYQAEAMAMAKALPATAAAMRVAAGAHTFGAGGFAALPLQILAPEFADPLEEEYQKYRAAWPKKKGFGDYDDVGLDMQYHRPILERPEPLTSVLGQLFAWNQTGVATPFAVGANLAVREIPLEKKILEGFGCALLGAATRSPFVAIPPFLASPPRYTEPPLGPEQVRGQLLERYAKDLAARMAADNIARFKEEVAKLKTKPEEQKAYIAKAIKQYHFEDATTMPAAVSIWDVGSDPALKKLRDALAEGLKNRPEASSVDEILGGMLASGNNLYDPKEFQDFSRLPIPSTPSTWWFWRVEDKPPQTRSFEAVRAEIEQAWRSMQAREIAREKAEEIKQAITSKKMTPEDALRYFRDQKEGHEFELSGIARLLPRTGPFLPGSAGRADFRPYEVPRDKIPYPPEDFLDRLMTLKEPGQALVLADRPGKNTYVIVLEDRDLPALRDFADLYAKRPADDPLYQQMEFERDRDLDQELMKQLRLEAATAANIDEDGNIKIPEGIRGEQANKEPT
jgi:hypothetical protein